MSHVVGHVIIFINVYKKNKQNDINGYCWVVAWMVFVLQSGATEYGVIRARTCPLPRGQGQDSREETVPAAKSRQQFLGPPSGVRKTF